MHDIIIKNGTLINGLETPAFKADIAINGDTITAIGDNLGEAKKVIDASGHSDPWMGRHPYPLRCTSHLGPLPHPQFLPWCEPR